jgi:transcriptional regulator with XRE-family HTH domain
MKSHELLRDIIQDGNAKQIAEDLGLSISMIYKWAEASGEGQSGTPNPLDRVAALLKSTGRTEIAQWVCEQAGGFYVKNNSERIASPVLLEATHQIVQEVAEVLSVVSTAAIDNRISEPEAKAIRRRWEKLKSITEGFVRSCEKGDFHALGEQAAKVAGH